MSVSDNLVITLLVVLCIDLVIFFAQAQASEMNPTQVQFHDYTGSVIESFDADHTQNFTTMLPEAEQSVSQEGNLFTDTFRTAKSWFTNDNQGFGSLVAFFTAPVDILTYMNTPASVINVIKSLWFGITLLLFVLVLLGRT